MSDKIDNIENDDDVVFSLEAAKKEHDAVFSDDNRKKKGGLFSRKKKKIKDDDDDYDMFDLGVELDDEPDFVPTVEKKPVIEDDTPFEEYMAALTWNHSSENNDAQDNSEVIPVSAKKPEEDNDALLDMMRSKRADKVSAFSARIIEFEEAVEAKSEEKEAEAENISKTRKITSTKELKKETPDDTISAKAQNSALDEINQLLILSGLAPISDDIAKKSEDTNESLIEEIDEATTVDKDSAVRNILSSVATEDEPEQTPAEEKQPEDVISEDGQLTLEGYGDDIEPIITNEREESDTLERRRKEKISRFHIEKTNANDSALIEEITEGTADITEDTVTKKGENIFSAIERTAKEKRDFFRASRERRKQEYLEEHKLTVKEIKESIAKQEKKMSKLIPITGVLSALLLILSFIPSLFESGISMGNFLSGGGRKYIVVNIILYALTVLCGLESFKDAISKLRRGVYGTNLFFLVANGIVAASMLLTLCTGINENSGLICYAAVGAASILSTMLTRQKENETLKRSITVLETPKLNGLQPIKNSNDSGALGYDLSRDGNPSIYYSADAKIPQDIMSLSQKDEGSSKNVIKTLLIACAFSVICAIIGCIIHHSGMPLCTVIPCVILLATPLFRPFTLSLFKAKTNKTLYLDKATIIAADECDTISKFNAVVVDATELLDISISNFSKYPGATMKKTDAVIFTASLLKNTKSLMSYCFDDYMEKLGIAEPSVENVVYEEGLGFSGWVNGTNVIVGNRKCLLAHSVKCPGEREEKKYAEGNDLLYTVIGGKIVATFFVKYKARPGVEHNLRSWIKTTAVVMINSQEPSLTEEKFAQITGTTSAIIKINGQKGFEIIDSARQNNSDRDENGILFSKGRNSTLSIALGIHQLAKKRSVSKLIQTVSNILLCLVFFLFGVTSISVAFTPLIIILLQVVGSVASYYIGNSVHSKK